MGLQAHESMSYTESAFRPGSSFPTGSGEVTRRTPPAQTALLTRPAARFADNYRPLAHTRNSEPMNTIAQAVTHRTSHRSHILRAQRKSSCRISTPEFDFFGLVTFQGLPTPGFRTFYGFLPLVLEPFRVGIVGYTVIKYMKISNLVEIESPGKIFFRVVKL